MPVADHPVHEKTIQKADATYGCVNTRRKTGYYVLTRRYYPDGRYILEPEWVRSEFINQPCPHARDPMCEGCTKRDQSV